MRYMMLIYESFKNLEARTIDKTDPEVAAWRAYHRSLVESGVFVGGAPLHSGASARTVRLRDGRRDVQDGPYAETKELLAGVTILELPSLDAALDWAARCPAAATGAVEVRPIDSELLAAVVT